MRSQYRAYCTYLDFEQLLLNVHLMGVIGTKVEAVEIKTWLAQYLRSELGFELSEEGMLRPEEGRGLSEEGFLRPEDGLAQADDGWGLSEGGLRFPEGDFLSPRTGLRGPTRVRCVPGTG